MLSTLSMSHHQSPTTAVLLPVCVADCTTTACLHKHSMPGRETPLDVQTQPASTSATTQGACWQGIDSMYNVRQSLIVWQTTTAGQAPVCHNNLQPANIMQYQTMPRLSPRGSKCRIKAQGLHAAHGTAAAPPGGSAGAAAAQPAGRTVLVVYRPHSTCSEYVNAAKDANNATQLHRHR